MLALPCKIRKELGSRWLTPEGAIRSAESTPFRHLWAALPPEVEVRSADAGTLRGFIAPLLWELSVNPAKEVKPYAVAFAVSALRESIAAIRLRMRMRTAPRLLISSILICV